MAGTPYNPNGDSSSRPGVRTAVVAPRPTGQYGTVFPAGINGIAPGASGGGGTRNLAGRGGGGGGGGNPLIDAMLGLLGAGGGGGGGGGYYGGFDGSAARAAANEAYNRQLGNTKNVYGQINTSVQNRTPLIQQGYTDATAKINADAEARANADMARNVEADRRNQATAAALGLDIAAPTDTAADALRQAGTNAYQATAQAWGGFNDAATKTALERNTATADAFTHAGAQAETQLAALLQQALNSIAQMEAANPGGYVGGGGGGGGSSSNDFKILKQLMDYDVDSKKSAGGLSGLQSRSWQALAGAFAGAPSTGYSTSQANTAALKALANNPRDFATLYSTLYK